ncbi:DNA glycosylase AlkZ-like family protein [Cupriavidus sp. IDO]|uniref:DNA glycosylase AlkZ-like family protein n=1 Tax=Cupriavidus sp. IDO TaxID=1539142 RepID=UPI002379844D|nr:crosslink repair DNA glycosylase YcaQ family protein [Cupriavidus sp. IDO]
METNVRRGRLVPVHLAGQAKLQHWVEPSALETVSLAGKQTYVHILSPFDPLVIQRKRLSLFFGYEHRFEAYVPAEKRVYGYFALPVLVGNEFVAAIDLKAERQKRKLAVQKWTWLVPHRSGLKAQVEDALDRFEDFQIP